MILDGYREVRDENVDINLIYMWHPPHYPSILSHWHERLEFIYVLEGSLDTTCGNMAATLHVGDLLVVNPNQLHAAVSGKDGVKYYALCIENTALTALSGGQGIEQYILPILQRKCCFQTYIHSEEINGILKDIFTEFESKEQGYELMLQGNVARLLALLYRKHINTDSNISVVSSHFEEVLAYIGEHFTEDIKMENVAEHFSFNKSHFCRKFKSQTGISFVRYVTRLRLDLSEFLLLTSDLPITQIALKCGFNDLNYFSRKFRERYGMSCSDYRRKNAEKQPNG